MSKKDDPADIIINIIKAIVATIIGFIIIKALLNVAF